MQGLDREKEVNSLTKRKNADLIELEIKINSMCRKGKQASLKFHDKPFWNILLILKHCKSHRLKMPLTPWIKSCVRVSQAMDRSLKSIIEEHSPGSIQNKGWLPGSPLSQACNVDEEESPRSWCIEHFLVLPEDSCNWRQACSACCWTRLLDGPHLTSSSCSAGPGMYGPLLPFAKAIR